MTFQDFLLRWSDRNANRGLQRLGLEIMARQTTYDTKKMSVAARACVGVDDDSDKCDECVTETLGEVVLDDCVGNLLQQLD